MSLPETADELCAVAKSLGALAREVDANATVPLASLPH